MGRPGCPTEEGDAKQEMTSEGEGNKRGKKETTEKVVASSLCAYGGKSSRGTARARLGLQPKFSRIKATQGDPGRQSMQTPKIPHSHIGGGRVRPSSRGKRGKGALSKSELSLQLRERQKKGPGKD